MIQSAWGGTSAEVWVSFESLRAEPKLNSLITPWEDIFAKTPGELSELETYYELMDSWFVWAFVCMGQKYSYGKLPDPPEGYRTGISTPSWLYNAMIAPLTPLTIRGVL